MEKKSLYWLVSTTSTFIVVCLTIIYVQHKMNRKGNLDYAVISTTELPAKVSSSMVSRKMALNTVEVKVNKSDNTNKPSKTKTPALQTEDNIRDSTHAPMAVGENNSLEMLQANDNLHSESTNYSFIVENSSESIELQSSDWIKPGQNNATNQKGNAKVSEYNEFAQIEATSAQQPNNVPQSTNANFSQNAIIGATGYGTINSTALNTAIDANQFVAIGQPIANKVDYGPQRATGTGMQDAFLSGGNSDNPLPYNDNSFMGSLPVPEGNLFLLFLSFIFMSVKYIMITYKKSKLN